MKTSFKTVSIIIALGLLSCAGADQESYSEDYKYSEEGAAASSAEYTESYDMEEAPYEDEPAYSEEEKQVQYRSEDHQDAITTVAASPINDNGLRFIRTAQIKFKTESVRKTTYFLEHAVINLGGIVTHTHLYSDIENVKKVAISNDSSLKITTYQMNNDMTIRIPSSQLDSLLKVISKKVDFLDYRIVDADEISLTELKNKLEQNRMATYQSQLKDAIADKKGKINNVVDAYENMLYKQKLEDEALIRNLELDYDVNYSLVQLSIYQDTSMDKELVENELNIEKFEPSFFTKLGDSFENGWSAILSFVVIITNAWFLLIPLIIVIAIYLRKSQQ